MLSMAVVNLRDLTRGIRWILRHPVNEAAVKDLGGFNIFVEIALVVIPPTVDPSLRNKLRMAIEAELHAASTKA